MTDGTMWQMGEEVVVEGLRLFVVKGKEKEAYALANGVDVESVDDDVVAAWVEEIRYGSVSDAENDDDIPVKDELVFWSCSDGKEGAMANGFPQGTVKGRYFLGSVRGALRANPQMAHADMWLALGLGNCTSDEWTEGKKLLEAKSGLKEVLDDAEYQFVEYLESNGTQWIGGSFKYYGQAKFFIDYNYSEIGTREPNGTVFFNTTKGDFFTFNHNKNEAWEYPTASGAAISSRNVRTKVVIDGQQSVRIKDEYSGKVNHNWDNADNNWIGSNGYFMKNATGKFYCIYHSMYNNYGYALVPCYRKSDNKPGMYDIFNGVFYTNQGTGEFAVGPVSYDSLIEALL